MYHILMYIFQSIIYYVTPLHNCNQTIVIEALGDFPIQQFKYIPNIHASVFRA